MLGSPKTRNADHPVTVTLETLVPRDHFYRHLDAALDLSFVRDWAVGLYSPIGRPSIDPVVFFKLQFVMFFEGIRSESQLLALAADRLSIRWYLGYNLDESLPDQGTLTRRWQRLGLDFCRHFFEHVVDLFEWADLVWGKELLADATRVPGNASMDSPCRVSAKSCTITSPRSSTVLTYQTGQRRLTRAIRAGGTFWRTTASIPSVPCL